MRKNGLGEVYCHTAVELCRTIDNSQFGWDCYLAHVDPAEGEDKACGEVAENDSGVLVCYIEADTEEQVREIAREARLDGASDR